MSTTSLSMSEYWHTFCYKKTKGMSTISLSISEYWHTFYYKKTKGMSTIPLSMSTGTPFSTKRQRACQLYRCQWVLAHLLLQKQHHLFTSQVQNYQLPLSFRFKKHKIVWLYSLLWQDGQVFAAYKKLRKNYKIKQINMFQRAIKYY
jgi:hypothetical protein